MTVNFCFLMKKIEDFLIHLTALNHIEHDKNKIFLGFTMYVTKSAIPVRFEHLFLK